MTNAREMIGLLKIWIDDTLFQSLSILVFMSSSDDDSDSVSNIDSNSCYSSC
jgi:hypothetical protein